MARADVHVYSFKNVICAIGSHMFYGMQYGLHELYRLLYWELHRVLRGIVRQ